jgi:two-component system phosphate regulon sensor histidine kinase PhoR
MVWRALFFLFFLVAGALAGGLAVELWHFKLGYLLCLVLAMLLWFALDASGSGRVLAYLRDNRTDEPVGIWGIWGEVAQRMHHLLRDRDRLVSDSQRRLQDFLLAFQVSPNGVVLLDSGARIEWCNQTATQHFGIMAQRDLAQAIVNLVRDPEFVSYLASRDYQRSITIPGRDNSVTRPVLLSVQLHPYGEGRTLLLSRDITALEQAEAMRRDFVANVSHEIRTPLTVLTGFIETLQTLQLDVAEQQHYLALMAQQSDRMQTLVSDLLTLSRLEGSPAPDLSCWIPWSQLVGQLQQDATALSQLVTAPQGPVHELVFDDSFDGQLAGNASELLSATGNLVSNAIRYTPAGRRIAVATQLLSDGSLMFSVQDTGPGIAPEHLGRLTERFYRVDRSRSRETGGTGLGLAIVKHVAQRHGATLSIESKLGKGSSFRISFPPERVRLAA